MNNTFPTHQMTFHSKMIIQTCGVGKVAKPFAIVSFSFSEPAPDNLKLERSLVGEKTNTDFLTSSEVPELVSLRQNPSDSWTSQPSNFS